MALSRITEAVASFTDLTIGDDLTLTDDLLMASDANIIKFGADADVTLTHVHNTGLLLNSTSVIQFNDASQNIGAPSATVLDINATDEIELNATLIDVNGNLDVEGTINDLSITGSGKVITMTGSSGDTFVTTVSTDGQTSLVTTDAAGTGANISIAADGNFSASAIEVTLDASGDISLDADGGDIFFKDAGTTFGSATNTSGNLIIKSGTTTAATFSGANVTFAGTVTATTAFVPDASDGAALGTTSLEFSDLFLADASTIQFGADQDVTITHVADTGILLNGSSKIQFTNAAESIHSDGSKLILTSNSVAFSLPTADGSSGQVLSTNGSGVLSFANASANTPTSADGQALGSASLEWSDLFLADGGQVLFGNDQEITLTHDADVGLKLKHTATADDKPIVLTLQTGETDMAANDVMGAIRFQAPDEGTGTDAVLVAAAIQAVSEGDFSSSSNATRLEFHTGASEAASSKMTLSSAGLLTIADDLIIKDGGTIGVTSDADAITIASNGQLTLTQTLIGTALDISGDIDVDGTTNLDALDVDGATNFALDVTFADGSDIITASAGTSNTRIGVNAGNSIASGGNYNVVIGDEAGTALTTGDGVVAIGFEALATEDANGTTTAIGYQALKVQNAGAESNNTAVGYKAGTAVTTGISNTFIGTEAGLSNTTGAESVAVGMQALRAEDGHGQNTAVGMQALEDLNAGATGNNTAVGHIAGRRMTTGIENTLIGAAAGDALTDADYNVAVGKGALSTDTLGSRSVAIGHTALENQNFTSATNAYNVCIGYEAGHDITTGQQNTLVGGLAGDKLTDADYNVVMGLNSLGTDTKGSRSTAVGYATLATQNFTSATNSNNSAFGYVAGQSITTGTSNTLIGANAGSVLTTGNENIALGYLSLGGNAGAATTADDNVAIGSGAAQDLTSGDGNVCIGKNAGDNMTTGQYNVYIGPTLNSGISASYNILVGPFNDLSADSGAHQIGLGYAITCVGNNNFTFGNSSTDSNIAFGATSISAPSDERLKEDIKDETVGLGFINELRPVTFRWKKEKDIPTDMKSYVADSDTRVMNGKYNHGFIAQEVKTVIDKYDIKDGLGLWMEAGTDGRQRLAESELIPFLTKAIQELSAKNDALEARIKTLEDA